MDKTQHTPGPWRVGPVDDTRVEDADGNEVAQIDGDYNQPETWPAMEANARLIAAAPDMLEALRNAERLFEHTFAMGGTIHKQMKAAIAKAEGRDNA